ncbi:MAG: nucleotidyltransferase [Chloroflexota bacterium]|nr:MAG: nucleotidyltransferase [Chloroflexota bacterium]
MNKAILRERELNDILTFIAETLDISPTDYERAVQSYRAIGSWLEDGYQDGAYPDSAAKPKIYPQGSIRLGTVVKPMRECKDAAYDVDLVCELQYSNVAWSSKNAMVLKQLVGDRLQSHGIYCDKLEPEGRRCWTIEYAKTAGTGFHIDVLPCVPDQANWQEISYSHSNNPGTRPFLSQMAVRITDKDEERTPQYTWSSGNPLGYAEWFQARNTTFETFAARQKQHILESAPLSPDQSPIYKSVQQIPNELVRTPLQRSIQILKRHRDIRFKDDPKHKPISMVITTLCAQLYEGEDQLITALLNIVTKLGYYAALTENRYATLHESIAQLGLVQRTADGKWYIPNPVNPKENFADRWHEEENGIKHARARAFFGWIEWVKQDIEAALQNNSPQQLRALLGERFGDQVLSEAWKTYEKAHSYQAQSLILGTRRAISRFDVPHRQVPAWPINLTYDVTVTGTVSCKGFRPQQFNSDSRLLPKHSSLRFEARTETPWPYKVYWQVVNTGDEARAVSCLRGGYYDGLIEKGGRVREERTLYTGMHWVECFIVRNGVCVARSGEFVVNIQ